MQLLYFKVYRKKTKAFLGQITAAYPMDAFREAVRTFGSDVEIVEFVPKLLKERQIASLSKTVTQIEPVSRFIITFIDDFDKVGSYSTFAANAEGALVTFRSRIANVQSIEDVSIGDDVDEEEI